MLPFLRSVGKLFAPIRRACLDESGTLRAWTVPVALSLVGLLSYGLFASQLGYFWDDWIFVWARHFRGLDGLKDTFFINRPPRAYFEFLLDPLLGIDPLAWQIFGILTRVAEAVALWWFMGQLWRGRQRAAFLAALFLLVFPGYSQQPIAMTYHYFYFFHAVFFLSLGLMVRALRGTSAFWPAMVLSWLLCGIQLFTNEYFFGLELLRPVILWLALCQDGLSPAKALRRALRLYAPYLVILAVYLYWRIVLFAFPSYQPALIPDLLAHPRSALISLAAEVLTALRAVTLDAWARVVQIGDSSAQFYALYALVVGLGLLGLILFQDRLPGEYKAKVAGTGLVRSAAGQMLLLGGLALLLAGIPSYIIQHSVTINFESDRLTMPFWFPVGLLLAGLFECSPNRQRSAVLAAAMAALAIGAQLHNAQPFRRETSLQQDFAWQLAWRAPAFANGTLLLSGDSTFPYTDDQGLTYLINWMYYPENTSSSLPLALASFSTRLGVGIPSLEEDQAVLLYPLGPASFEGSTSQSLVVYFSPPSCLRLLGRDGNPDLLFLPTAWDGNGNPAFTQARVLPVLSAQALSLADLGWILPAPAEAAAPPQELLGAEPEHGWCYYFEKADLASQLGDWAQVERLGDEALVQRSLRPGDLSEYLVFLQAALELERWPRAGQLSQELVGWAPSLQPAVCALWQQSAAEDPATPGPPAALDCRVEP